jgi:hypothetical protein
MILSGNSEMKRWHETPSSLSFEMWKDKVKERNKYACSVYLTITFWKTPSIAINKKLNLHMNRKELHMDNSCPCMLQGDRSSAGNRMFKGSTESFFFLTEWSVHNGSFTQLRYMETYYLAWRITTVMRFSHHRVGYTNERNSSLQVFYLLPTRWVTIRM